MGGAKGGSDFSPRGKSDREIMRFCQAFILELWRNLGPDQDVPAGDIGVGGREVGYMYGMYKKLTRECTGTFTGKGFDFGGSRLRPEATGFGALYFVQNMLAMKGEDLKGKTVAVSGFGNVAWGAATKATELGAKVVTISGPDGYIYDPDGISGEKINYNARTPFLRQRHRCSLCGGIPRRHILPRPQTLGAEGGYLPPLRHTERSFRRGCQADGSQWCSARSRGFQHGMHPRGYRLLHRKQAQLCSRQGSETPAVWPAPVWR